VKSLFQIVVMILAMVWAGAGIARADSTDVNPDTPPDSGIAQPVDTPAADSLAALLADSLGLETSAPKRIPKTVFLLDSLVYYFAGNIYRLNVHDFDRYPRNAAGMIEEETSYFSYNYLESPLRTPVRPFGLPGRGMNVQSGYNEVSPYDRTLPADGALDFEDIPTADIASAALIEGPLSAFASLDGGISMLYLEPFEIPTDVARSEFTVERGAYGYAYTRGRIARWFTPRLGMSFSTDFRTADGLNLIAADDAYMIKSRVVYKRGENTTIDSYLNFGKRSGDFPVEPLLGGSTFKRYVHDRQFIVSITREKSLGGQVTGKFEYHNSRSRYSRLGSTFIRALTPTHYKGDFAYLLAGDKNLLRISGFGEYIGFGHQQLFRNEKEVTVQRRSGAMVAGFSHHGFGSVFFYSRFRGALYEKPAVDAAIGFTRDLSATWSVIVSGGHTSRWPDLADRFVPYRQATIGNSGDWAGGFAESGNPDLNLETRISGNVSLIYSGDNGRVNLSINGGKITDLIYYNRVYSASNPAISVFADNDDITFSDFNLSGEFYALGPFFGKASVTGRALDSDRYGSRLPYAPRWQVYGRIGLRHFVDKYKVNIRLFGDVSYSEKPLSYTLKELSNTALVTGGFNLSLKSLTFYYMVHDLINQYNGVPEGYGYTGYFYTWGFNWKFID